MTLTDQILQTIRTLADGEGSPANLEPLVGPALQGAEAHLEQFRHLAQHNPEIPEEMRQTTEAALLRLKDGFEILQARLAGQNELTWEDIAKRIEEAVRAVREQQKIHADWVDEGPTSNHFVNRLLIHMEAWLAGKPPGPATLALVDSLGELEKEFASVAEGIEDEQVREDLKLAQEELVGVCRTFASAAQKGGQPPKLLSRWRDRIIELSDKFDQLLADRFDQELSEGPTSLPVVNLVFTAIDRYLAGEAHSQLVAEAAEQSREVLRLQMPDTPDPALQEAADLVFEVLDRIRDQALAEDRAALTDEREALANAAENLAMFAAVLAADEEVIDVVQLDGLSGDESYASDEMPRFLSELLSIAQTYVSTGAEREDLEEAAENLGKLISRTEGQLNRSRDNARTQSATKQVLETLKEIERSLPPLLEEPSDEQLIVLEELLLDASVQLKELVAH